MNAAPTPVFRSPPTQEATRLSVVAFARQAFDAVRFCDACHHVGFLFEEDLSEFPDGGWYRRFPCVCNTDSIRDHAAMRQAGAPDSFVGASLSGWNNVGRTPSEKRANDDVMKKIREIATRLDEASRDGLNLWLYGSQGSGKTWVACSLLREAILTWGYTGRFFHSTEIVRASIDDAPRFAMLYDVGWLVLDGFDRVPRTQSGYSAETVYALVNHRVQNRAPTIFTAHVSFGEGCALFGEKVGKDLLSVLAPVTVPFALVGGDFSESKGVRTKWDR